jgi:hypothetical protein
MAVEKQASAYAGTFATRALKGWHDASERYPVRRQLSALSYDDVSTFVRTREMSWHQTFSHGL